MLFRLTRIADKLRRDGADGRIAFIEDVHARGPTALLDQCFARIWLRRVPKPQVNGLHGTLFYELAVKTPYCPTLRDEEAANPGGSRLR